MDDTSTKNTSLLLDIGQGLSLMLGLPTMNFWTTQSRPPNAKRGMFGFNTTSNSLEYFDGSDWFEAPMSKK